MAKRVSSSRRGQSQGAGADALADARTQLLQLEANRQARGRLDRAEARQFAREKRRLKTRELQLEYEQVRRLGFYTPRLETGERLTAATATKKRAATIRKAFRQLEALQRGAVFAPYPTRSQAQRKVIARQVRAGGGKVTKRGVYLPRAEREARAPAGKLVRDASGDWIMQVPVRWTGQGGQQHVQTEYRALDGARDLTNQEARLKARFDALQLGKNERVRFRIGGADGNASRLSFRSFEAMQRHMLRYRKDARATATFMRSLTMYVVTKPSPRSRVYNTPVAWVDAKGRRREASTENLGGVMVNEPRTKGRKRRSPKGR